MTPTATSGVHLLRRPNTTERPPEFELAELRDGLAMKILTMFRNNQCSVKEGRLENNVGTVLQFIFRDTKRSNAGVVTVNWDPESKDRLFIYVRYPMNAMPEKLSITTLEEFEGSELLANFRSRLGGAAGPSGAAPQR